MGSIKSKAIVYLIISAVVIILIKLWLHYTSWLPIATIRAEEQARAVCKEYVLTCESVEINELIRGEPYAYLTVKVSDAEKLDKETLFECVRKLNHITCGKLHISAILESGYRKYRMDISYSESVLLRNNAWYYATDEAKQSYKKERNQERNERRRQARKCEVTNCENEKLPACHYCEEHKCIESGCDSLKDAGSEYCALHRPSKKTRRRSSQKENYEYEDADDFYYDHMDEYENYDDAQDDWGDY